jgi:hypothetical protein
MSSTKVVGYFNNNRWPVIISISAVNVNLTVSPRVPGRNDNYVIDRDTGKKINDPLLERFVGPDMLSRETSKTEVPLLLFPRPVQHVTDAHQHGVASSNQVIKDSRGIVQDSSFDGVIARNTGVPGGGPSNSGHSVATYTVEEAVKKRIFRPVIIPDDSNAPKETDGQPARGDNLPPLMVARDATPAEARRLAESGQVRMETPVRMVNKNDPPPAAPEKAGEEEHEIEVDDSTPVIDVGAQLKSLQAKLDVPEVAPPAPLVAPVAPPVPVRTGPASRPDKFVCSADGRSFKKKGYLLNHVKKHFADREKELMAPYANEAEE